MLLILLCCSVMNEGRHAKDALPAEHNVVIQHVQLETRLNHPQYLAGLSRHTLIRHLIAHRWFPVLIRARSRL